MSRVTSDDQVKFLMSCIRWSNNGKVNFEEVSKQCNIVSKAAAAKRYERLMTKFALDTAGNPAGDPDTQDDGDQAESAGKSTPKTPASKVGVKGKTKTTNESSEGSGVKKRTATAKVTRSMLATAANAAGGGKARANRRLTLDEHGQMPDSPPSPSPTGKPTGGAVKEEPADDSSENSPVETDPLLPKAIKEEDDGDESDSAERATFDALCGEFLTSPRNDEFA